MIGTVVALLAEVCAGGSVGMEAVFSDGTESVWPKGLSREMNSFVGFRTEFEAGEGTVPLLDLCAWGSYRVTLNGRFVGFGPARGPKGMFRPDRWRLADGVRPGRNDLLIEVSGHNVPNYYLIEQPPFFKATLRLGDRVLAESKVRGGAFAAVRMPRTLKVPRYSFQRTFAEHYRLPVCKTFASLDLEPAPEPKLIPRRVPYPDFEVMPLRCLSCAAVREDASLSVTMPRFLTLPDTDKRFKGYSVADLEENTYLLSRRLVHSNRRTLAGAQTSIALAAGESVLYDRGFEDTGFPGAKVTVSEPGRLVFTFDEVLSDGEVRGSERYGCCNAIVWDFTEPGVYEVEAFEPYALRYLDVAVLSGRMVLSDAHFRSYKNPTAKHASLKSSDPALERIFAAAVETFRQNAVDVFTDCPGRERAGWNCDAYFTSSVSTLLTGNTELERVFEETLAMPQCFDDIPEGMFPMCYPGDHRDKLFIPNWAMWFVLESEEYLKRSGDEEVLNLLRPRFLKLVDFLGRYRNADGLLEKLPSWIFVEWSRCNELVRDVNYPSNMTWADALDAIGRLCNRPDLSDEANRIRKTILMQSWTGEWFCDNAVRQPDGALKLSGECTETCQYYAFFHRIATPETHPGLWKTLLNDFGPSRYDPRDRSKLLNHPEVWPSNAFIGNYLRLKLFERMGMGQRILDEAKGYFLYMADRTGTLWENDTARASCNHGFASYIARLLVKGVLGAEVDLRGRKVSLRETDAAVDFCEVTLPAGADFITVVRRRVADGKVALDAKVPAGWTVSGGL